MTTYQRLIAVVMVALVGALTAQAQDTLASRLLAAIRAAGVPILDVSIGQAENRATWRVRPTTLQPQAQPIIDAFDPDDPAHETADLQRDALADVDRRFMAAYTWVMLKRQFPSDTDAQTKTKLAAMRDAVVTAYLAQPWK